MAFISTSSSGGSGGGYARITGGVLSVAALQIDVQSISQLYETLVLTVVCRSDRAAQNIEDSALQFNGDGGANYTWNRTAIDAPATIAEQAGAASNWMTPGYMPAATSTANQAGIYEIIIPGYAGTTFQKMVQFRNWNMSGAVNGRIMVGGGVWLSTAAINRITFKTTNSSNLIVGSRWALYGLA